MSFASTARDILSDTNEVEFGMINRIYGKRTAARTAGRLPAAASPAPSPGMLAGKLP